MQHVEKTRVPNYELSRKITADICEKGMKFDPVRLEQLHRDYEDKEDDFKQKLWDLTYPNFNPNSSKQVKALFTEKYDCIKYATSRMSKTVSFKAEVLEKIYAEEGLLEAFYIRWIRSFHSSKKSIETLLLCMDENDRVHPTPSYGETSRVSYTVPSLTNLNKEAKLANAPEDDCSIYSFDYSQQELYIMSCWWHIQSLIDELSNTPDGYTALAKSILHINVLDKEHRDKIKTGWIANSYGSTVPTISVLIGRDLANLLHDSLEAIPEYKSMKDKIKVEVKAGDYIATSFFGTARDISESPRASSKPYVRRAKLNNPIQITGSDILCFALEDVTNYIEKEGLLGKVGIVYTIHDELLISVRHGYEKHIEIIKDMITYQIDDWLPINIEVEKLIA